MKTLIVLAHPDIEQSVVNKYLVGNLPKDNPDLTLHNLYKAYPDGVIDVKAEQELIEKHDRIIFQFPLYWYSSPYLLKKWQDEVLAYGWAYGDAYKLEGKEIGVAVSAGGAEEAYKSGGLTMDDILIPFRGMAYFVKAKFLPIHVLFGMNEVSNELLSQSKDKYLKYILG